MGINWSELELMGLRGLIGINRISGPTGISGVLGLATITHFVHEGARVATIDCMKCKTQGNTPFYLQNYRFIR